MIRYTHHQVRVERLEWRDAHSGLFTRATERSYYV
jgi:hypothetical protein